MSQQNGLSSAWLFESGCQKKMQVSAGNLLLFAALCHACCFACPDRLLLVLQLLIMSPQATRQCFVPSALFKSFAILVMQVILVRLEILQRPRYAGGISAS